MILISGLPSVLQLQATCSIPDTEKTRAGIGQLSVGFSGFGHLARLGGGRSFLNLKSYDCMVMTIPSWIGL